MIDIDTVMQKFCRGGAHAVQRYCEVSGDFPESMPEYFMPAFVFNQLGDEITVTLEVGFETLVEWNEGVRKGPVAKCVEIWGWRNLRVSSTTKLGVGAPREITPWRRIAQRRRLAPV